jgi:RNA polymerase sigma-70 factor (ECF subfamily)
MKGSEEQQFIEAYNEHADALFRFAYFKVSDRDLAKDLVQETFMKTWSYRVDGGQVANMKAFLFRTLGNLIIDHYRKHKATSLDSMMEDGFEPASDNHDAFIDQLDGERALLLVKQLPDAYRDVVFMRYVDELSLEEISEITGESKNAVTVRVHRGIKKLQALYEHKT